MQKILCLPFLIALFVSCVNKRIEETKTSIEKTKINATFSKIISYTESDQVKPSLIEIKIKFIKLYKGNLRRDEIYILSYDSSAKNYYISIDNGKNNQLCKFWYYYLDKKTIINECEIN